MSAAQAADSINVPVGDLGQSATLTLATPLQPTPLTVPVPEGLRPQVLTGVIEVATDGSAGMLEVTDGERRLLTVDLRHSAGDDVALRVPLGSAKVVDHAIALSVDLSTAPGSCVDGGSRPTTVRHLRLGFGGSDAVPTSIATFLPPVLHGLDLYVPAGAGSDVRSAAVSLAGAVAARYRPAAPTIRVRPWSGSTAVGSTEPLTRSIVLTGDGDPGLALGSAPNVLTIAGSGAPLAAQVSVLSNDLGRIALATRASATRPQPRPELAPSTQSLSDLGLGTPTDTGRGSATTTLGLDAAALGTPAARWTAHLIGTAMTGATPSAASGRGTLAVSAAGQVLGSWPIPDTGQFDVQFAVPASALGRYTALDVTAETNGAAPCSSGPPITLTLDPNSTVTATPAQRPLGGGFADFPAVLRPSYQIATDGTDLASLAQAITMAVSLQRLVNVALDPQLVDVATLMTSTTSGVLLLRGARPDGLALPLSQTGQTITLADGSSLQADAAMATLQVSASAERTLLVASGSRPALVDGLVRWLGTAAHLGSLTGDVAIWSGSGVPTSLQVTTPTEGVAPVAAVHPLAGTAAKVIIGAIGGALLLALVVGSTMLVRRRPGGALARPVSRRGPPSDHDA